MRRLRATTIEKENCKCKLDGTADWPTFSPRHEQHTELEGSVVTLSRPTSCTASQRAYIFASDQCSARQPIRRPVQGLNKLIETCGGT